MDKKTCTRILLGILQSFLHFLKARNINSSMKQHQEKFPMLTRESKFQIQRQVKKFNISFISPVQVFYTNFKICFRHFCVAWYFKESQRSLQYKANNLGKSFCPLFTRTLGGFFFKYIDILTLNKSAGKKVIITYSSSEDWLPHSYFPYLLYLEYLPGVPNPESESVLESVWESVPVVAFPDPFFPFRFR